MSARDRLVSVAATADDMAAECHAAALRLARGIARRSGVTTDDPREYVSNADVAGHLDMADDWRQIARQVRSAIEPTELPPF